MFGRNGECAAAGDRRAQRPATASTRRSRPCRIAIKHMTPVMLLTDGYLANGAEPWRVPDDRASCRASTSSSAPTANGFMPYARDETLARAVGDPRHAGPRAPHRRPREETSPATSATTRQPRAHGAAPRREGRRHRRRHPADRGPRRRRRGDLLVRRLGRHVRRDPRRRAQRMRERGHKVGHVHLRYLNPLPSEPRRDPASATNGARARAQPRPAASVIRARLPGRRARAQRRSRASRSRCAEIVDADPSAAGGQLVMQAAHAASTADDRSTTDPARADHARTSPPTRTSAGARAAATTRSWRRCRT